MNQTHETPSPSPQPTADSGLKDASSETLPSIPQMALSRDSRDTRRYVVGFIFDFAFEHVALIRKNKPAWQAGKLNGIGGKIEASETPERAMWREGNEEAGIDANWNHFCSLSGTNNDGGPFELHALWTYGDLKKVFPMEEEQIEILPLVNVAGARSEMIGNLPWLIEMARDFGTSATAPRFVEARYGPSVGAATDSEKVLEEKEAGGRNAALKDNEESLEALWKATKGINPETGRMWLTPRMAMEAAQLTQVWKDENALQDARAASDGKEQH